MIKVYQKGTDGAVCFCSSVEGFNGRRTLSKSIYFKAGMKQTWQMGFKKNQRGSSWNTSFKIKFCFFLFFFWAAEMIFLNIWWAILILQLSPPWSEPIHLETSVLLFYFCVFLWQDIKSENDNMLNEWTHSIFDYTRADGAHFGFWQENRMLNGGNLDDVMKRKGNEPPCVLLLMHKQPSYFPSPAARSVTRRLAHSPAGWRAWWLRKCQGSGQQAGGLEERWGVVCAELAFSHPWQKGTDLNAPRYVLTYEAKI